jgi:RNA polymerase sigma factor (sigma-70 family)
MRVSHIRSHGMNVYKGKAAPTQGANGKYFSECEIDAEFYKDHREFIDPDSIFKLKRGDKWILVMFLEVSEAEYRKERSEQYKAEWNKHALEGCKVTGKSGKLIPCRRKNCSTCERCHNGNVISIESQYEEYQHEFASDESIEDEFVKKSVNAAFHQAIEDLKDDDYKIIQLVLQKKSDSEIADILGLKSKQAVQYKRTKIEAKLREVMKPWFE